MNIKFIKAERTSLTSVQVHYTYDDREFVVNWNCIHPETGKIGIYDLNVDVECDDVEIKELISDSIKSGETDENKNVELYLFVRDTFDNQDCIDLTGHLELLDLDVTDTQLHVIDMDLENPEDYAWYANFAINDLFMIQYTSNGEFSIPSSHEAAWSNETVQDTAAGFDADELAELLGLPTDLKTIYEWAGSCDTYGDERDIAALLSTIEE